MIKILIPLIKFNEEDIKNNLKGETFINLDDKEWENKNIFLKK